MKKSLTCSRAGEGLERVGGKEGEGESNFLSKWFLSESPTRGNVRHCLLFVVVGKRGEVHSLFFGLSVNWPRLIDFRLCFGLVWFGLFSSDIGYWKRTLLLLPLRDFTPIHPPSPLPMSPLCGFLSTHLDSSSSDQKPPFSSSASAADLHARRSGRPVCLLSSFLSSRSPRLWLNE